MHSIREAYLPIVKHPWPLTLYGWELLEDHIEAIFQHHFRRADHGDYVDRHVVEPCSAIRLGRTVDLPEILPAAFYHLCRLNPVNDGDLPDYSWSDHHMDGGRTANRSLLTAEDANALVMGQAKIKEWVADYTMAPAQEPRCPLGDEPGCTNLMKYWQKAVAPRLQEMLTRPEVDVLRTLNGLVGDIQHVALTKKFGLCKECASRARRLITGSRARFWLELPGFFDLAVPGWEQANKDRVAEDTRS